MSTLRQRPMLTSLLALVIAAGVLLGISQLAHRHALRHAFHHMHPAWLLLVAAAELVTYLAYAIAYRSVAKLDGSAPLPRGLVARIVIAGFGPFVLSGGFAFDKRALSHLSRDEASAQRRVALLGALELAILTPLAWLLAIVVLVRGDNIPGALIWPWIIAVPPCFAACLWISAPRRTAWLAQVRGGRHVGLAHFLEGVGAFRTLFRHPRQFVGAWVGIGGYWATDIIAFYAALWVFGLNPATPEVVLAYATGYLASRRTLPLGGAGVTEALMTLSLVWLGLPLAPSLCAVLAYRLFNFGAVAAPALVARQQLIAAAVREALPDTGPMVERARARRLESLRRWARGWRGPRAA